jgi:hypothetical protein
MGLLPVGRLIALPTNISLIEKHALKKINNCWNTNISFYLDTSGGQSYNLFLYVVYFVSASFN